VGPALACPENEARPRAHLDKLKKHISLLRRSAEAAVEAFS